MGAPLDRDRPLKGNDRFRTTQWSLVRLGKAALNQLVPLYRPALVAYLITGKGIRHEDAEDLVQGFIQSQMWEKDLLAKADQTKGRFRTLLLTALDRYVNNHWRRLMARKRRGKSGPPASLDANAQDVPPAPAHADSFTVAWARQLVREAVDLAREHCQKARRSAVWGVFEARLLRPAFEGVEPASYAELCQRFGMKSPTQTACRLATGKRIFERKLRAIISRYVTSEEEIDEEIEDLIDILASSAHDPREDRES